MQSQLQAQAAEVQSQLQAQAAEVQDLRERVTHVLPLRVRQRAARSLFQLRLNRDEGAAIVGVGVFFHLGYAVTADHNLAPDAPCGTRVFGRVIDCASAVTELTFNVVVRDKQRDVALLHCLEGKHTDFLEPITDDADCLVTGNMALCSFQCGIHEELPEFSHSMGVFHALCSKISTNKTHALYQSVSWPGDSGAALLLYDGLLVGIHLCVVNDLAELIDQEQSLDDTVSDLASSVRALIAGTSHGCVALLAGAFPKIPV